MSELNNFIKGHLYGCALNFHLDRPCNCGHYEAAAELAQLEATIENLEGMLSGDPHLSATKEQREAWRLAAIRYSNKLEKENSQLRIELGKAVELLEESEAIYTREHVYAFLATHPGMRR